MTGDVKITSTFVETGVKLFDSSRSIVISWYHGPHLLTLIALY